MKFLKFTLLLGMLLTPIAIFTTYAQKTITDQQKDDIYYRALELYKKQKYGAAMHFFKEYSEQNENTSSVQKSQAEYYEAMCAMNLYNNDAELLTNKFIVTNPESPLINDINFSMGNYQYNRKRFMAAIPYFEKVKKELLSNEQKYELYFKSGYCYYLTNDTIKARNAMYEIKDIDTKYSSAALYYYSHIAYLQKNYETALSGLLQLQDDETFAKVVPYYIAHCYYFQEKYDELLKYAPALVDSVVESRRSEMSKLVGDAYYKKNQYKEALPYLEKYVDNTTVLQAEDKYQIANSYYKTGKIKEAAEMFEKTALGNSVVSQNSSYLLGDCYIKLGDKNKARMAFASAAKQDFDLTLKEDAMFNYAVVTFELSYSPFNDAMKALTEYLVQYPNSKRADEAYNYLVIAFLNTKNYQEALSYIEKIKNKDKNIKKAYQRVAFFRGLELFNNLRFQEAMHNFELAYNYSEYDALIKTRTYYWMAETYYRLNDYILANDNYNLFLAQSNAQQCDEYKLAYYNLAYCSFNKKEYSDAATWFLKYTEIAPNPQTNILADAYNRLGDCSFMEMKYDKANEYYSKSAVIGLSDKDYALFQKGFSLGLQGKHNEKITLLNQLINETPKSNYVDDALYETGRSNEALQNPTQALKFYNRIISDFPQSSLIKKAWLQIGLINYNDEKNIQALDAYKKVVADFPGTQEARSALTGIKNIYVEMNDVDGYIAYADKLGMFANISMTEQDSLTYFSAEKIYMDNDCVKSKDAFKKYLEKFPDGSFVLNASFYKADCNIKDKEYDEALLLLNQIIEKPRNTFTESALLYAARINRDKGKPTEATECYLKLESIAELQQNKLEAQQGLMTIYYQLKENKSAIDYARKVLQTENLPEESVRKARYILAKSLLVSNETVSAIEEFKKLAKDVKNPEGAEARYRIIEIQLNQGGTNSAEKEIFEFAELHTPYQFWVAKSFIVLSDIYLLKNDIFQASSTLQSILDNYETKDDGIINEVTLKLKTISGKEPLESKKINDEEIKIK